MRWGDLTPEHAGKRVSVFFSGGRKYDDVLGPYIGVVHVDPVTGPYMIDDHGRKHHFSWAFSVAFL